MVHYSRDNAGAFGGHKMNFETILFAAAFLLLGILSLSRNETPPIDQAAINDNREPIANSNVAPVDDDLLSTRSDTDTDTTNNGNTEAQAD